MKTLKNILFMGGTAAFCTAALPSCGDKKEGATGTAPAAEEAKSETPAAKNETVSIALTGLKWATACGNKVRSALTSLDGVTVNSVSKTEAKITVDRSKVNNDQLTSAVTGAGDFTAVIQ